MSESTPYTQPLTEDQALKLVLVDQSRDAQDEARDRADERLDKELGEGNGFKKFVNGIWKGNIAKDYYRQKYVNEALESIQTDDDILTGSPANRRTRALESTIERFQSDYDEVIHTEAGESREKVADDSQLAGDVKHLIREFVEGRLNTSTLREERTRLLNDHYARTEQNDEAAASRKKGIATTDNLLEIAQAVAGVVEHGESLDNALGRLEVITGEARNGARTEANYTSVDKSIDWLSKRGIASFVTPGTLAVGTALAMSITRNTAQSVTAAVGKTLIPGAVAGIWAGVRENKRTKDERAQHAREMAVGGQFEDTDKRRVDMERARYDTIPATTLVESLRSKASVEQYTENGPEAVQAALDALACIQARVQLSDSKKLDLISYSSKEDVGEERMMLDLARRDVRLALEASLTPDVRTELSIAHDKDIRELLQEKSDIFSEILSGEEISDKDRAFAKLKARRVFNATAVGVATGIVGGVIAQEVVAGFDPERYGLIDMIRGEAPVTASDGEVHQTIIGGFIRGEETTVHTSPSSTYENYNVATNGNILLSDDSKFEYGPNGTMNIVDPNGETSVDGLVMDANGTLDQASLDKLDAAGMVLEDRSSNTTEVTQTTQEISGNQYVQNHIAETTAVTRDLWYGNDTPGIYDQNELRVYRGGGDDAPGLVDGGYQYTVAGMTTEGSWQGGESVNWNEAANNGNLFVAISGTYDTQGNPFMIPIGPDGSVNIPAGSPAGQFFANEDNSVAFNGAYMEIVQTTGQDENGIVHMRPLATLVGDAAYETGSGEGRTITETVTTETTIHHAEYTITTAGYDTVQQNSTESAPITPVASRKSLEVLKSYRQGGTPETRNGYYYYGGESIDEERKKKWRNERSPRLKRNPDADLNTGKELDWYRDEQMKRRGEGYVKEIVKNIEENEILKNLTDETKAFVCIPVAAASESENIYRTLSMFARQDSNDAIKESMILLNVNWKQELSEDPEQFAKIQKTLSEIERARTDFPDLKIASFNKIWTKDFVDEKDGRIYGEVIKVLYDTAALAVDRAIKEGGRSANTEALIITNDADTEGMSRSYLRSYLKTFKENPKQDAFTALIRRGTEAYKEYPGYGVVSAFYSMMAQTMLRQQVIGGGGFSTDGPNSGIRLSMYAAMGGVEESVGAGADGLLSHRMSEVRRSAGERTLSQRLRRKEANQGSSRVLGKFVPAAAIDTVPDRLLGAYKEGKWIASGWDNFDSNGYEAREDVLARAALEPEDVEKDIDSIAARIEASMNGFGSHWWGGSPGAMKSAMTWTFGLNREDIKEEKRTDADKTFYEYRWDMSKQGDGRFKFKFTEDGKKWLKDRLLRDSSGRLDPYGARLRRQLYNEVEGSMRQPAQATARMLS